MAGVSFPIQAQGVAKPGGGISLDRIRMLVPTHGRFAVGVTGPTLVPLRFCVFLAYINGG